MKIYIKDKKKRIFIPLPLGLLKAAMVIIKKPIVLRHMSKKERDFIETMDFKELRQCVDMLKEYKGLKVVDIKDSEGNRIIITI